MGWDYYGFRISGFLFGLFTKHGKQVQAAGKGSYPAAVMFMMKRKHLFIKFRNSGFLLL